jgi:uncharacterized DUF497 family protein
MEFDAAKSERNARERGLPFSLVAAFDFDSALIVKDLRRDYGEVRYRAIGQMSDVVAVVVFTMREDAVRVISLRLANTKERLRYERQSKEDQG